MFESARPRVDGGAAKTRADESFQRSRGAPSALSSSIPRRAGARVVLSSMRSLVLCRSSIFVSCVVLGSALAAVARAQAPCFEAPRLTTVGLQAHAIESGDLDLDGDADVAISTMSGLQVLENLGNGTFAAPIVLGAGFLLALADLDGDGRLDVVSAGVSSASVRFNLGGWSFSAPVAVPLMLSPFVLRAVDLDADGDIDLAANAQSGSGVSVALNHGNGTFAAPVAYAVGASVQTIAAGDLDGDGDVDLAVARSPGSAVRLDNQGNGSFVLGIAIAALGLPFDITLGDLDGDGDLDIVACDQFSELVAIALNTGGGAFGASTFHYWGSMPSAVKLADLEGDGALDLFVGYSNEFFVSFSHNPGNGNFTSVTQLFSGAWPRVITLPDLDRDGDVDVVAGNFGNFEMSGLRDCRISGVSACAGDGSGTPCPCGNDSAPGAGEGCLNSLGLGGRLRGAGSARLALDGLVLRAEHLGAHATAVFFQGTQLENGGAGIVFNDGLTCAGGSIVRLGTKTSVAGVATYPGPGDTAVSVRGALAAPGELVYQVAYRNSAPYCTPGTSNTSNALRLLWAP